MQTPKLGHLIWPFSLGEGEIHQHVWLCLIPVCRTALCSMGGQLNHCHWLTRWCPMWYRPGSRRTETNWPSSRPPQRHQQPALTCRAMPKTERTPQTERRMVLTPYLVSTLFYIVHNTLFPPLFADYSDVFHAHTMATAS